MSERDDGPTPDEDRVSREVVAEWRDWIGTASLAPLDAVSVKGLEKLVAEGFGLVRNAAPGDRDDAGGAPAPEAKADERRWAVLHHADKVTIEPVEGGCRQQDCCGGTDCGIGLAEAQAEVVAYHQRLADLLRAMTPDAFLKSQGYGAG